LGHCRPMFDVGESVCIDFEMALPILARRSSRSQLNVNG
jgi:hypothetical protein